jgi:hypothetical protein
MDRASRTQHEQRARDAALAYYDRLAGHGDDNDRAIALARALVWHSLLPTFVIDDGVPGRKAWAPWKEVEDGLKEGIAEALIEHAWAGKLALCLGGPFDWEVIPSDDRDPLIVPVGTAHVVYRKRLFGQVDDRAAPTRSRVMTIYVPEDLHASLLGREGTRDRIMALGEARPELWTPWHDVPATPAPVVDDS